MPLRSIPSQVWVSALLGSLSVVSILITLQDKEIPGARSPERSVPSQEMLDELSVAMQRMLSEVKDWPSLCRDPLQVLLQKGELGGRKLEAHDERWIVKRKFLTQLEKDALGRCETATHSQHFCFHLAPNTQVPNLRTDILSSSMNLFELHLDFRKAKRKVACDDLKGEDLELEVYYTAYWEDSSPGSSSFHRISSGLRMKADPSITAAALASPALQTF